MSKGKGEASAKVGEAKMVGEAKLHLESNLRPTRDAQRAQTNLYAHQETPQRLK